MNAWWLLVNIFRQEKPMSNPATKAVHMAAFTAEIDPCVKGA
jgi:hypothetical protein